jgi:spiro-SPASM protein
MGIIVYVDLTHAGPYLREPLDMDGTTAFDCVVRYVRSLPETDKVFLIRNDDAPEVKVPPHWKTHTRNFWTASDIMEFLVETASGTSEDTVLLYAQGDAPFLDAGITERMLENHRQYYSEYTFGDGFPRGYAPELLDPAALERMVPLASTLRGPAARTVLFDVISSDINAFDLETELSGIDLRYLRLQLFCDIRRRHLLCSALYRACSGGQDVMTVIQNNEETLMTLPAYISVQVTRRCPSRPMYLPDTTDFTDMTDTTDSRADSPEDMNAAQYREVLHAVREFAPDSVIGISCHGEAALHPDILDIIRMTTEETPLSLVVETSGIGWSEEVISSLIERPPERTRWIIELDASEPELYRRLRGEGFEEAKAFALRMIEAFSGSVWVQAVRLNESEHDLAGFYKGWTAITPNVIIQKYNDYCGIVPDRKPADIAPLERYPCWHLKRDLVILTDGTVPLCGQDLGVRFRRGNVFTDGLESVWEAGRTYYRLHLDKNYPDLCSKCDEYYTFNF